MVNVETDLNNLKTKLDNLDVNKLKNVYVDLKKNYVIEWIKKLWKKAVYNKLNKKVNNFENKFCNPSFKSI